MSFKLSVQFFWLLLCFVDIFSNVDCRYDRSAYATTEEYESGNGETTENEIPVFPSTTSSTSKYHNMFTSRLKPEDLKRRRILKFLRHFQLDFSAFDTTCIRREGRGLPAPPVSNARVVKYTRRRNRSRPRNYYAMVLFQCNEGFDMPFESTDRMFCSRNKWVGPTPVCLPKESLGESECIRCDQICSHDWVDGVESVVCSCYAGYEMAHNGTCVDVNECETDNGGCHAICFNQPGSYQCFCPSGHQVAPDGKSCIDKNECLLRNGHGPCQDRCENTPGSYVCSCENISGTRLAADKHSCEDVNECLDENFGCSHMCLNTFGNAFCACPPGFSISTDNYKTCISTEVENDTLEDADSLQPPPENLEMMNTVADCPPGSSLDSENSLICVEHDDCSLDNGGCEHICIHSGDYRICACRKGYDLINETACMDVDECAIENGGCDQECTNIGGTFFCSCKPGYVLKEDKRFCEPEFCGELPTVPSAVGWECEHEDATAPNGLFRVGTRCRASCLPGYSLTFRNELEMTIFGKQVKSMGYAANKHVTCSSDGSWTPSDYAARVHCAVTSCPTLIKPTYGTLFPENCLASNVPLHTQCLILCQTGYYPKNGRLRTCSQGYQWFPEEKTLCVRLPATPRPYIHCPSDVKVDLMPGMSSAYVKIPQPQANMDWYRYVEAEPPWAKNLEWEVQAGLTEVLFTARSPVSNDTATCKFQIHVVDQEAPRVQGCPTSFEIRLNHGETSREIWWSEPKFTDNVKLHYVQQSHTPGRFLNEGTHHISYIAGDAEGNKARCSFTITVHGQEEYEMSDYSYYPGSNNYHRHMIICPNLKTGRWTVHYAYYLPPGCRYSNPHRMFAKVYKKSLIGRNRRTPSSLQNVILQHFSSKVPSRKHRRNLRARNMKQKRSKYYYDK